MRQRDPVFRDKPFMGYVKRLPCLKCAVLGRATFGVDVAHVGLAIAAHGWREAGVQEKAPGRRVLPLCPAHHRAEYGREAQHGMGERKFYDALGICPACVCISLSSAFDAGESGVAVIWSAVRARRTDGRPTC